MTLTFASWNQIALWPRQLDNLRSFVPSRSTVTVVSPAVRGGVPGNRRVPFPANAAA